jgi:hypothetical protein
MPGRPGGWAAGRPGGWAAGRLGSWAAGRRRPVLPSVNRKPAQLTPPICQLSGRVSGVRFRVRCQVGGARKVAVALCRL